MEMGCSIPEVILLPTYWAQEGRGIGVQGRRFRQALTGRLHCPPAWPDSSSGLLSLSGPPVKNASFSPPPFLPAPTASPKALVLAHLRGHCPV